MNIVEALHKVKNDLLGFITTNLKNKADATHTHIASEVGADEKGSAANALASAQSYTDNKIADLINSAPTTLDTLGEIAAAMAENDDVVAALETSIGNKANVSDLEDMQTQVDALQTKVGDTEVSTQISNAIAENNKNYYTASEVDGKFETLGDVGGNADEVQADLDAYKTANDAAVQAAQAKADAAVVANQPIVGSTYAKITYDSKGLVTGGADLSADDIPEIGINKVTDLQDALDAKQNKLVFNTEYNESTNKVATMSDVAKVDELIGDKKVSEQITEAVAGKADIDHSHDDKYYTESEIDSQMVNKSDVSHAHDDLYYTETEIDAKLANKVDAVDGSRLITESEADKLESLVVGDGGQIEISGKVNANNVEGLDDLLALKVDKVDGMGLSTNDYTDAEKQKLADVVELVGDTKVSEQIEEAIADKADNNHNHDDVYYTESEMDSKLSGKSDTGHNHDNMYYTESEIDTKLANKVDVVAGSRLITTSEADKLEALVLGDSGQLELSGKVNANNVEGLDELLATKVDVVAGKVLSTNDYTNDEKAKLANVVGYVGDESVSTQIENAIANKADVGHTHNEYALTEHTHDEYALQEHVHTGYATAEHDHSEYALVAHKHDYTELENAPTALPANGGDADTVDGKHANEFALASDLATVVGYVGDTKVSEQIEEAISDKADIDHTHDGYALTEHTHDEYAIATHEHDGYATVNYVTEQVGTKVDKVTGMGLSTNDYTDAEQTKLSGIEDGANKTIVDEELNAESVNPVQNKVVQAAISEIMTLIGDKSVSEQIQEAMSSLTNLEEVYF